MKIRKLAGLLLVVSAAIGMALVSVDALVSVIFTSGKVTVTEMAGSLEFTSNPFTTWTSTLNIQSGATWRARMLDLTIDYEGSMNITWTLYDCGADGIVGSGDDSIIPLATFEQPITVVRNVPQTVIASVDGFNPYNWGQWTSSPIEVYLQTEVHE